MELRPINLLWTIHVNNSVQYSLDLILLHPCMIRMLFGNLLKYLKNKKKKSCFVKKVVPMPLPSLEISSFCHSLIFSMFFFFVLSFLRFKFLQNWRIPHWIQSHLKKWISVNIIRTIDYCQNCIHCSSLLISHFFIVVPYECIEIGPCNRHKYLCLDKMTDKYLQAANFDAWTLCDRIDQGEKY